MSYESLAFLNAWSLFRRYLCHLMVIVHFAWLCSHKSYAGNAFFLAFRQGCHNVFGIARGGNPNKDVSCIALSLNLMSEDILESIVVANGCDYRRIRCQ